MKTRLDELQDSLDDLRPKHAALVEKHQNSVDNGAVAGVSNLIGSSVIAIAGFCDIAHENLKFGMLGGGIVFVLLAVWFSLRGWFYSVVRTESKQGVTASNHAS